MRILISGSHGLVGGDVARALVSEGHTISRLVRGQPRNPGDIQWTPGAELAPETLKGIDGVVHLAGRTVAGRWSDRIKAEIRDSRVEPTAALARSVAASFKQFGKPSVLVSASAIGFYGSRGDEFLTESSAPGHGFLAETCMEWEAATAPAVEAGVRVVNPRIALVLSRHGGALAKMLPIFQLGLAGRIGSGHQWWSWISLDDLTAAITFSLTNESVRGPVNASAAAATNQDFTRTFAAAVHRPAIFPMPARIARVVFASAADELMLSSQRVVPEKLDALGFQFRDRELKAALERILAEPS